MKLTGQFSHYLFIDQIYFLIDIRFKHATTVKVSLGNVQ